MSEAEDTKSLRKALEKISDQYDELKKDYSLASKELQDAKLEMSKMNRRLNDTKHIRDTAIKTKHELDVDYKRNIDMKKDNDVKIRALTSKLTELQFQLDSKNNNKVEQEIKKAKDISEVEKEKESLKSHQRHYDRMLDEERRALQGKFLDAKLELKKTFQKEVDDLKLRHEKQMAENERNHRRLVSDINETSYKKIGNLENENHQVHTKLNHLNRISGERESTIADLEKKLRRELLNVEVTGTSKIDWIKEQSTPSEIVREFKIHERKIEQLRYKLNQTENEVDYEKRQTTHYEIQAKELQRDLNDQELSYQRLEAVKDDLEKRLTERVEQLTRELNSKNEQLEAEFTTIQVQLEASISDKDELIKALKQEIRELSDLASDSKQNTQKLSIKLTERLDTDRAKFIELDKDRRDASAEVRRAKKELEETQQRVKELEKESDKYQKQYSKIMQEIETIQANNQKLEKAERRLQTRV